MTFKQFNLLIQQQFTAMQEFKLFRLNITGQQIWETYLSGFKPENDPVFRDPNSSTHTCNNDMNFIRRYGNVVAVDENYNIISMFDIDVTDTVYEDSIKAIEQLLSTGIPTEVFFETFEELNSLPYEKCTKNQDKFQLGHIKTLKKYTQDEADKFGKVNTQDVYEFWHFHTYLSGMFVDTSGKSVESIMGNYRNAKNVFERAMQEIPLDTLILVKDLIIQGSLLNGEAHLFKLEQFIPLKEEYDSISAKVRNNWCWVKSYNLPIAKFRNELIGTLCVELAEGIELNEACLTWNKRVDPANYMKAKAPIIAKQIAEAAKFIEENGYTESFNRRFATLSDIDVSEIKHMNVDGKVEKQSVLFAGVQPSVSTRHKRSQFDGIEEVSIDDFMSKILPTCASVEAFMENRLENNLVSLIAANVMDSKPIFKWSNNYSWTYNGNLTGKSQIKENVKAAGGKITGLLRCSLQWNDDDTKGCVDYDLHCVTPFTEILYNNKGDYKSGGKLDVDMIRPSKVGIENITWQKKMPDGIYKFKVHTFCSGNNTGFKAEIEFDGNTYNYHCNKTTSYKSFVDVATLTVKNGVMSIQHHLPETNSNKTLWNIQSGEFHKVNLVCLSPNHWGSNNIGNKHYFFMLDGCHSDVSLRSFHNEYLIGDLLTHRKVTEVLADTTRLTPTKAQLAGLGFNSTVQDEIIVKLTGSFKRTVKIKF